MNGKWIKPGDCLEDCKEVKQGNYYIVIGKKAPFSREYLMIGKVVGSGLVCPVTENYIWDVNMIYSEPIEIPEELR